MIMGLWISLQGNLRGLCLDICQLGLYGQDGGVEIMDIQVWLIEQASVE